ncbi:metal-dependent transcriptional regulator [Frigoriflavimonas asaccharolytica]|uniref:Transcriptional regulator MntR n=1 Tax=Frigoriflavimonas asaccharolytica TaxID=2735899 RepID=A0A8J8G507_9FLAO|nr:metal-dependent transcriptional regulator [Frigoriflavimonas asaccharolytica]NRS91573.1 DtxR family Mn-dependent transcriptional regulator [Frigoriflavimonas asaccharolytica]
MKNTTTEENYLKALFHLCSDDKKVTVNEVSKFLDLKMPSINNMMKKFHEKKWVIFESYKPIIVTEEGMKQAALIVRKHRLTEMFLVEKMNFGWENVHEIAEQLEHLQSEIFFEKMDEILNFPKFDPHGEAIPDKEGNIISQDLLKLSQCKVGDIVIFKSVTFSDSDFLEYLNDKKIQLGCKIEVLKIENFDHSVLVKIDGKNSTFSGKASEKLLVKK